MLKDQGLSFGPYWLDPGNERLWRGKQGVRLTGKAFQVLRYLVERSGQLVTKEELFGALWPETVVSDAALTSCIQELRRALRDEPKRPRYIETVHRRGFRFIGNLSSQRSAISGQPLETRNLQLATRLVGREVELEQLQSWLQRALAGERQVVFVTGEAGIGKTTVVEAFLERLAGDKRIWIGRGQCAEHYGAGEAYLPVLEAFGRLCRGPEGKRFRELLGQYAPTWLVQMPALLSAAEQEKLQRQVMGATRERMLREIVEALEALTVERALVLRLEDLQWSDVSTLDLLSVLARRQEPARLMVIGTYRLVDVIVSKHPLKGIKEELQLHGQCQELALDFLTEEAVGAYLGVRFAGRQFAEDLARFVHQCTDGNPLFMVNMVDYLVRQGVLREAKGRWELKKELGEVEVEVPGNLQQMIGKQLGQVSSEQRRVLEAASVVGAKFSAAAVAAGLETEAEEVERVCEELVRGEQFLRARGTEAWPDGTVAACYSFVHALYENVLYERVTAARRVGLHRRIGEREETGYGGQAGEIAAELAMHFERGRDYGRAAQYLGQAGENAIRRNAHLEAINLLTKGLELLKTLPDTPERTQQELTLQIALGVPLMATKGYAALEVEKAYARALELCQQVGEAPQLFRVLRGLRLFYEVQGKLEVGRELGEQLLSVAQSVQDPAFLVQAHYALGETLFWLGEFVPAREHLEQGITLYDSQPHRSRASGVACRVFAGLALWFLGYPSQALERSHEALTLAQEQSHPFSLAFALAFAAMLHQLRREWQAVQERAGAAITLSTEHGFLYWLTAGTVLRGWALAKQEQGEEGIAQIRQGLASYQTTGTEITRPNFLALLAEVYGKGGQATEGLSVLAEALAAVHKTGERYYEAELYRLKGELTLAQSRVQSLESRVKTNQKAKGKGQKAKMSSSQPLTPNPQAEAEAEAYFQKAVDIARRQSAKSLELRAVMSLSRLWQRQGKEEEARQMLGEIYGWFTEGFDTADLKEAKTLLKELAGHPFTS